jgi:hypothetical protein
MMKIAASLHWRVAAGEAEFGPEADWVDALVC